jgi:hypothetical protein
MTDMTDSLRTASSDPVGAMLAPDLATRAEGLDTFPFPSKNQSRAHTQRWVEKTGSSITKSETPQSTPAPSPGASNTDWRTRCPDPGPGRRARGYRHVARLRLRSATTAAATL